MILGVVGALVLLILGLAYLIKRNREGELVNPHVLLTVSYDLCGIDSILIYVDIWMIIRQEEGRKNYMNF